MISITTETGDTKFDNRMRVVRLETDIATSELILFVDQPPVARFDIRLWPRLLQQVQSRELHRWQYDADYPEPLGLPHVRQMIMRINSTACFQLFCASVEIGSILNIAYDRGEIDVNIAFLSERFHRLGSSGLYFVPNRIIQVINQQVLSELMANNKICRLSVTYDLLQPGNAIIYYVPYATPSAELSHAAQLAWLTIRDLSLEAKSGASQR